MSKKDNHNFESLTIGNQGGIVLMIQKGLNHLGYKLTEDALFSQEMHEAIVKFQKEHNLMATGIVDYETMLILDKDFIASI